MVKKIKLMLLVFITGILLTSCDTFSLAPRTSPTIAMETAMSFVQTEIAKTTTPTETPVPPTEIPFGSPTAIPGPNDFILPVTPRPNQQVYVDPEGWYLIYFPADMKPAEKENLFSSSSGTLETGYLADMGYMSHVTHVCAWVANVEFASMDSTINWSFRENETPNCTVLTKTLIERNIKIEIFENPAADPEHRFVYLRTSEQSLAITKIVAFLQWQKNIQGSEFVDILKPFSQKEMLTWRHAGLIEKDFSVEEYLLPAEAQVGPRKVVLSKFVPKKMLPDWDSFEADLPVSTPVPALEDRLKSLGYELRTSSPDSSNYNRQLFRDGRILFDNVYGISGIYDFQSEAGPITTFTVTTMDWNSYIIQNDIIRNWEYNIQDPGFKPILYNSEVLWLKTSKDNNHVNVVKSNQEIVYSFASYTEPLHSTERFLNWNGHWIFLARDFLIQDGEVINKKLGFEEIFHWTLVDNQPVYFFRKGPRIGISYNGKLYPLEYQEVAHYLCCALGLNDPDVLDGKVHFFGKRNGYWYYVVVKLQ